MASDKKNPVIPPAVEEVEQQLEDVEQLPEDVSLQLADVEALARLLRNLKKESVARRTKEKLMQYKIKAEDLWAEIQKRHQHIMETGEANSESYHRGNVFGQANSLVNDLLATVSKYSGSIESNVDIQSRSRAFRLLEKFTAQNSDFFEFDPDDAEIEFLIRKLDSLANTFVAAHDLVGPSTPNFDTLASETNHLLGSVEQLRSKLIDYKQSIVNKGKVGCSHWESADNGCGGTSGSPTETRATGQGASLPNC